MKIICPNCHSSYHLDSRKVPETRFKAKCPKCEHKFIIDPEGILASLNESSASSEIYKEATEHEVAQQEQETVPHDNDESQPTSSEATIDNGEKIEDDDIYTIYPELAEISPDSFAIETIFSANKKGSFKNSLNEHKLKIILAVQDILLKMLADDEVVMKIGRGSAYYSSEIPYANGIFTLPYNYFAIACTNKRLLFINIDPLCRHPTDYKYQMPYEVIRQVKRGIFLSSLIICLNRGKCRNFTTVKRSISKEIQEFIDQKINESQAVKYADEIEENICPDCLQPVFEQPQQCPHCRVEFKDPKKAMLKSLALPGWGTLYLGHTALGILEIFGTIGIWAVIISLSFSDLPLNIVISLLLLLIYNGTSSLLTFFLARKGCLVA